MIALTDLAAVADDEATSDERGAAPASSVVMKERIRAQAYGLGFDLVGIATLGPVESAAALDEWVERGFAGDMEYIARGAEKRRDTRLPVPGATSAIVVGLDYGGAEPAGPVARYARGDDYHEIMVDKLRDLQRWIGREVGGPIRGKAYVDTGPILERELARRAGLGWFGKNTLLINPKRGSYFFLGVLLIELALEPDAPFDADRCGSCTRCLDACPTGAFTGPRVLDATKCISYLTIETKGEIPEELRAGVGERIYGCDVCQEVCPYNHKFARELSEPAFAPRSALSGKDARSLAVELLAMSQSEFSAGFRGSPMKRAKLRGLKRNSAVVLGNIGSPDDVPALAAALSDSEPLVRAHAAWALGRIGSPEAREALRASVEDASEEASLPRLRLDRTLGED
ncbi:MAG TPA: tRNA epoxyqueuosine(34) reductase QueG [Gemmatimonadaceae bacterium]|nr:tRNA epoxyqueuosine(34) reductase QueG [Gemmatimonadaceae bacterium]